MIATSGMSMISDVCPTSLLTLLPVIQVFMWLYALSSFMKSSPASRKGRLPYIVVSFLIMCLSTICAIMESTMLFDMLLDTIPGDENAEATLGVVNTYLDSSHWIIGGLMWDIAIRIADGMLVCTLFAWNVPSSQRLTDSFSGVSLLYCLVQSPLGRGCPSVSLPRRSWSVSD